MLDKVRSIIAFNLARKASAMIKSREFEKILKGLDYFKYSLLIAPMTPKERETLMIGFKQIIEDNKTA